MRYVALLRGINVGGNKKIKMADLRGMFEDLGLTNVTTLLASGNVVFESSQSDTQKIELALEKSIVDTFGFEVDVIVKTSSEIQELVQTNPFRNVDQTKDMRLYVTFLQGKGKGNLKTGYQTPEKDIEIVFLDRLYACCVVDLSKKGTLDMMKMLEDEYGKGITTRNWKTVKKISDLV